MFFATLRQVVELFEGSGLEELLLKGGLQACEGLLLSWACQVGVARGSGADGGGPGQKERGKGGEVVEPRWRR